MFHFVVIHLVFCFRGPRLPACGPHADTNTQLLTLRRKWIIQTTAACSPPTPGSARQIRRKETQGDCGPSCPLWSHVSVHFWGSSIQSLQMITVNWLCLRNSPRKPGVSHASEPEDGNGRWELLCLHLGVTGEKSGTLVERSHMVSGWNSGQEPQGLKQNRVRLMRISTWRPLPGITVFKRGWCLLFILWSCLFSGLSPPHPPPALA